MCTRPTLLALRLLIKDLLCVYPTASVSTLFIITLYTYIYIYKYPPHTLLCYYSMSEFENFCRNETTRDVCLLIGVFTKRL